MGTDIGHVRLAYGRGRGRGGEGRTHRAASNALFKGINVVGVVPSSHEGILWGTGLRSMEALLTLING